MKRKYTKPTIKSKRIKTNFFFSNERIFDSFDELLAPNVFASSHTSGCSSSGCFLPGTSILMSDGSKKAIQEIKEGDSIFSYNTNSKTVVVNKVSTVFIHNNTRQEYLTINDTLKVTPNHPIWVNQDKWQEAGLLKIGDELLNSEGKQIKIESITKKQDAHTVYNLEVDGVEHNYFAEGILAHNKGSTE